MAGYASGKYAYAISDRSGMRFPYDEMVREWNGSLVHYSEYEPKQPQLQPKPVGSDPIALFNPRPQPASVASLILLDNNPFTSIIYSGTTYVNVYSEDHQRKAGEVVRFRGPPEVISSGSGGADAKNLQRNNALLLSCITFLYAFFAIWGAGIEMIIYSLILILIGTPIYLLKK